MGNGESIIQEVDELSRRKEVLLAKQENAPTALRRLFWCFLWAAIAITLGSDFKLTYIVICTWIATIFIGFIQISSARSIKEELDQVAEQHEKKIRELEDAGKVKIELVKKKETEHEVINIEVSPLCNLWDKLTGGYVYNKNALICPECRSHNGLRDPSIYKDEPYVCPNCKKQVLAMKLD